MRLSGVIGVLVLTVFVANGAQAAGNHRLGAD